MPFMHMCKVFSRVETSKLHGQGEIFSISIDAGKLFSEVAIPIYTLTGYLGEHIFLHLYQHFILPHFKIFTSWMVKILSLHYICCVQVIIVSLTLQGVSLKYLSPGLL